MINGKSANMQLVASAVIFYFSLSHFMSMKYFGCSGLLVESKSLGDMYHPTPRGKFFIDNQDNNVDQIKIKREESASSPRKNLRHRRSHSMPLEPSLSDKISTKTKNLRFLETSTVERKVRGSLFFSIFPFHRFPNESEVRELKAKTTDWALSVLQPAYGNLVSISIDVDDIYSNRLNTFQVEVDLTINTVFESSSEGSFPSVTQIRSNFDTSAIQTYVSDYLWKLDDTTNPFWNTFGVSQQPFLAGQQNKQMDLEVSWVQSGTIVLSGRFGFGYPAGYDPEKKPNGNNLNGMEGWLNTYIGKIIESKYSTVFRSIETSIDVSSAKYNGGETDTVTMEISFKSKFDENSPVLPTDRELYQLMSKQDLGKFIEEYLWKFDNDGYWSETTQISWTR